MDDVPSNRPDGEQPGSAAETRPANGGRGRLLAVALVVLLLAVVVGLQVLPSWLTPLNDLLSFKTIGLHYATLKQLVDEHFALAALLYVVVYGLIGLLLLPGSSVMVVSSGLLFGAAAGIPLAMAGSALAATLGYATGYFLLANTVKQWAAPVIEKLGAGFKRHALSYMLFIRLTPGISFGLINAVPPILGVPYLTYIIGTVAGLLPSRIALGVASAGLANAIALENEHYTRCVALATAGGPPCGYNFSISSLLTVPTVAALAVLALIALSPALIDVVPRVWRRLTGRASLS